MKVEYRQYFRCLACERERKVACPLTPIDPDERIKNVYDSDTGELSLLAFTCDFPSPEHRKTYGVGLRRVIKV